MEKIGKRIKELRKQAGLKQHDLAGLLGVNRAHISKIETGAANPSPQLAKLICEKFMVREEWLKEGELPKNVDHDLRIRRALKNMMDESDGIFEKIVKASAQLDSFRSMIHSLSIMTKLILEDELRNAFVRMNELNERHDEKLNEMSEITKRTKESALDFIENLDDIDDEISKCLEE